MKTVGFSETIAAFDLNVGIFYDKVKFRNLDFYKGKCDNDGFLGNYCSL